MKFKLQKLHNCLVFQILEQTPYTHFKSWNGVVNSIEVSIESISCPQINLISKKIGVVKIDHRRSIFKNTQAKLIHMTPEDLISIRIYVRGDMYDKHKTILTIPFKDNVIRDKVYNIIIESFKKRSKEIKRSK